MPTPTITVLPTPPSVADPATFNARADAFLGALGTFVSEANILSAYIDALLAGNQITNVPAVPLADGPTVTVDITLGNAFKVTLAGNRLISFTGGAAASDGKRILLMISQDATGTRVASWDSMVRFGTDVTGAALTVTASKTDYVGLVYNHAALKYDLVTLIKGY